MVHATRRAAIILVAAVVFAYTQHCAFVSGPASLRSPIRELKRDVSCKGSGTAGLTGQKLMIKLPKAFGFAKYDVKEQRAETYPVLPRIGVQRRQFVKYLQNGEKVSDVFVRFEGKTPWKKVGEVTHNKGRFEDAIKSQYSLIMSHAHLLHKKIRYLHHTDQVMQFGYANENAEIVQMSSGFYPLGTEPEEIKVKLKRSGWRPALKPKAWRGMKTNIRDRFDSKKDFYRTKPHLLKRGEQTRLEIGHRWYNPDKAHYLGPSIMSGKSKRGIVQNPSMGGSLRRKTWKKKHNKRKKFR